MPRARKDLQLALRLLSQYSTRDQANAFLQSRNLPYSAPNWDEFIDSRLWPAYLQGDLTSDDVLRLLRDAEEHGRQHVFLYHCPPEKARLLIAKDRVRQQLEKTKDDGVLGTPIILDKPQKPTIVDVRWDTDGFVLKIVERRQYYEKISETTKGSILTKRYRLHEERAVTLFKLHSNGVLELRIHAHKNSTLYQDDVKKAWHIVRHVLPRAEFSVHKVTNTKTRLWADKQLLQDEIRHNYSELKNANDTRLTAATRGSDFGLFEDEAAADSLDNFLVHGGYCDETSVLWLRGRNGPPSKEVRTNFSRELNEIAVTTACSKEDYDHILRRIEELNS